MPSTRGDRVIAAGRRFASLLQCAAAVPPWRRFIYAAQGRRRALRGRVRTPCRSRRCYDRCSGLYRDFCRRRRISALSYLSLSLRFADQLLCFVILTCRHRIESVGERAPQETAFLSAFLPWPGPRGDVSAIADSWLPAVACLGCAANGAKVACQPPHLLCPRMGCLTS